MEEIVIDMKTIEVQLLSSRPKTAIVREILRSLSTLLKEVEATSRLSEKIEMVVGVR